MAKHRLRINIEDEAHLSRVASLKVRWWVVALCAVTALAITVAIAVAVIMFTSLKETLPGYLPPQERKATIGDLIKVDSLQRRYEMNEAYLNNIMNVLNTERAGGDSLKWAQSQVEQNRDSLLPTSQREKEFRAMMDERERYNLSILAPLAADGMIFESPAPGYSFAKGSEDAKAARLLIPSGEMIRTLTDGTVTGIYYIPSTGYSITIQHNNGFLTRWTHLGLPLVKENAPVAAGEVIAPTPAGTGRNAGYVVLEMWRNGTPLIPYSILRGELKTSAHNNAGK